MAITIYDELGGAPAVEAVVEDLYRRVLADPCLSRYFEGKDLARIKGHQRALLTVALGGRSETYRGRMMHPPHKGVQITDAAFDSLLGHLADVLVDTGARRSTVARVLAILQPLRADVVQLHPVSV